jgi:glycerol-3-phosphate acyltransferase PlsY
MPINSYLAAVVISYLLGSIPFGYLLVRMIHREDVRSIGSGNIGATNVARRSPALGATTLALDAAKGLAAVALTRMIFPGPHQTLIMAAAGLCAVIGHLFPIWLRFRGGKGVATGLGSFAIIAPKSVLCVIGIFVVVVAATRYVSLGSVLAAALFPLFAWMLHEYGESRELIFVAAASLLIMWRHRQNIGRLLAGTESRLGSKQT